jgi:2-(1,2-epoxy-1,2-dihydrophenyl)acetyl-CoA isomerase
VHYSRGVADEVLIGRDGAVLTITLNRPDAMNALTRAVHEGLADGLAQAADRAVRCVVITGAGRAFCAGQDIAEFREMSGTVGEELERTYHPNVRAIRALEKPVIAAVNGATAGAGLSLALVCDVRVASETAVFVPGFVGLGLVPDAGGSWFLERLLGYARALEWMSSNRRLPAGEALSWGLVGEVLPAEGFAAAVAELAARWASMPTRAIASTKRLLAGAHTATLEEQLAHEAAAQDAATDSADFVEGVAAFLEKRPPSFTGS